MAYRFYLGGVLLPVTPGKLSVKIENKNKTVTLIDRGEINLLKSPGLSEISFDILLPSQAYPFANESVMPPRYYLSLLESYKSEKKPFQLVVTRDAESGVPLHGTSLRVSVEDYEQKEDAEEYGTDICVTVNLKQYKEYGTKTVVIRNRSAAGVKQRERDNAPKAGTSVSKKKAGNPVALSKKYYGNSSGAKTIAKNNGFPAVKKIDDRDTRVQKVSVVPEYTPKETKQHLIGTEISAPKKDAVFIPASIPRKESAAHSIAKIVDYLLPGYLESLKPVR